MQLLSTHKCFGGQLGYYKHAAGSTACDMRFTAFVPPGASATNKRRALMFLSGLTCTEENFTTKAGAYRVAAELGLVVIAPDTSPRGASVPAGEGGEVGFGAGFYVNATKDPWAAHYRMESYVADELVNLIMAEFPITSIGLCGHSMGGHGALTLFQRHPGKFRSLSAFAPICAASQSSWSKKAFTAYFGDEPNQWEAHDACALLQAQGPVKVPILVDQGMSDPFLPRLQPQLLEAAAAKVGQRLILRRHDGYDHGYFFVQSFIEDHLRHHAE